MSSERLPAMKTLQDAIALSKKKGDSFYVSAFVFQAWLGEVVVQTNTEYAEKKNPKDRSLQSGQAWAKFKELFSHAKGEDMPILLMHLFRFTNCEDPMAAWLAQALVPLSYEDQATGEYFTGSDPQAPGSGSAGLSPDDLARINRSLARWCDWLDALVHFKTHQHWHLSPQAFDLDPDKRELAALGLTQRNLGQLDESARARWLAHFLDAAERFKDSEKWTTVGRAMSAQSDVPWIYADVDATVIALWPLVKKHNWTYRDLLNVIRSALKRPEAYPCDTEQDLAAYCTTALGLRKKGKGVTATNGKPEGFAVAMRLIQ